MSSYWHIIGLMFFTTLCLSYLIVMVSAGVKNCITEWGQARGFRDYLIESKRTDEEGKRIL